MDTTLDRVKDCLQNEPAFCTAVCPFHLDVRDFIRKIRRGSFNAAYRTYVNAVAFPGIVAALCPEPCKTVCPRKSLGGAISLRLLERAAMDHARSLDPDQYNVPVKDKKVAVIGAGISGLACALRLSSKKYHVTVFEKTGIIGGHLHEKAQQEVFLPDINRQFMHERHTLCLNTEIRGIEELVFDAIYIATGAGGSDFGFPLAVGGVCACNETGVFAGGSLTGADTMHAIADGLRASVAIESYLKTGRMTHPSDSADTRLKIDTARIPPAAAIQPCNGETFTSQEAIDEAKRCLGCSCDACTRSCDLMRFFKKYPRRIAEEVEITIHPGTLDGNGTVATRLISTCTQCGLCREVCPQRIDTGELLLLNHRIMREKGAMPWAFHDFFLRDMFFSNQEAGLCRPPRGYDRCGYLFFPGCQIGGSDMRYVVESYRFLLQHHPDTGLMLGCCGAPAEWAGDASIRDAANNKIREQWVAVGKPAVVFACPTCRQMFDRHLPEIQGIFLYELMLEHAVAPLTGGGGATVSVFDPCSTRENPVLQDTVRTLVQRAGYTLEPLPAEGAFAQCCSWGGQVSIAHPPFARFIVKARISEGAKPYITYCSNCRDIFAAAQKPSWHLLDIMFGLNRQHRMPPTITERRENRMRLKHAALNEFWGEENNMEHERERLNLSIPPELRKKLNDALLLETDIEAVISYCETSGRKVCDPAADTLSGHLKIGNMTYWVEYRKNPDGGFELVNAYAHRMSIEESGEQ